MFPNECLEYIEVYHPFVFAANSDAAEASSLKSNSPCTTESKCSMTSSGLKRRDLGDK